jgi:hypothetical protein
MLFKFDYVLIIYSKNHEYETRYAREENSLFSLKTRFSRFLTVHLETVINLTKLNYI